MTLNPIDEIKQIRHQLGKDAGFDIHRIFLDLRATHASSGRSYVQHSPRRVSDISVSEKKALLLRREAERTETDSLSSRPGEH